MGPSRIPWCAVALVVVIDRAQLPLTKLFEHIREAWFGSVRGLGSGERPLIALDVDEPLWHLSKYGCTRRDPSGRGCPLHATCVAARLCVPGTIRTHRGAVELDT